ncbi:hypothetical protein CLOACE_00950 [Clostridium acetireducens DSM 10703]|uniref:Glycosyltransferase RgtA/B/C/D-like domain-containing protein n=1 Tax=Clostridium acetireducens DSM 10703 TaxID=1121290 RepID=A0A1E8F276_9CLOT|nr:glycosyltransferase family 39 protein [Clostridium acetireducens]OFI07747.1 hypothetical protein CLOACE_00950 [Clostridium acetireducens DSM 10703]
MRERILKSESFYKYILLFSFLLSIIWIGLVKAVPFSDFEYYNNLAINIAKGGSWGNTYTSVGYSIVLGLIYKIFGVNILWAKIFNVILAFLNNLLVLGILKKLSINERDKRIIFFIFAFFPNNIFYNSIVGTEVLFSTILLLITYIYFSNINYKYIYIGILVGINTMIKPFFIVFFLLIFILEAIKFKNLIKIIKNTLTVLVISFLTISPWIYRNTKLMGQLTYVSNNGGIVLYINNNSQNKSGRWMAAEDVENSIVKMEEYKKANMTERNKMLGQSAKKWIKSHPKQFIQLGFKRLYNTYFTCDDVGYSMYGSNIKISFKNIIIGLSYLVKKVFYMAALVFIVLYSFVVMKHILKKDTDCLNFYSLYFCILFYMFTCVYFITEGQGRYAFPTIFIAIYFSYYFIKNILYIIKIRS